MTEPLIFLLNTPEGDEQAVLHTLHGDERCNRDDMKGRQKIDAETADALVSLGEARRCEHCLSTTQE